MRKQFRDTVVDLLKEDDALMVLLGDIAVWGFSDAMKLYPDRVLNIGILEQATVGLAAGLSMTGMIPIFHSIAPFVVERAYEFLKLDFGYQRVGGNFVSTGASFDYAGLGCTHHCPADVALLKQIPGMEIIVPGTATEFDQLFRQTYNNKHPTYFRLSEQTNLYRPKGITFGEMKKIYSGNDLTIIAVGPTLDMVLSASHSYDCTVLYCTTLSPFDYELLYVNCPSKKILLVEPYYEGGLLYNVFNVFKGVPIQVDCIGVPHTYMDSGYGTTADHKEYCGLTVSHIRSQIERMINA